MIFNTLQVIERKFVEDRVKNGTLHFMESNINLQKKNSEIISVLMGLRRAMANRYGGV